jgi:hypothetical protein
MVLHQIGHNKVDFMESQLAAGNSAQRPCQWGNTKIDLIAVNLKWKPKLCSTYNFSQKRNLIIHEAPMPIENICPQHRASVKCTNCTKYGAVSIRMHLFLAENIEAYSTLSSTSALVARSLTRVDCTLCDAGTFEACFTLFSSEILRYSSHTFSISVQDVLSRWACLSHSCHWLQAKNNEVGGVSNSKTQKNISRDFAEILTISKV